MDAKRYVSWGCGVQSTALAVMVALGDLPGVEGVITADLVFEPTYTQQARRWYTDWLGEHGLAVSVVQVGDIREVGARDRVHVPFWTEGGGPLRRQCTRRFKVLPVRRRMRELLGYSASVAPAPPAGAAEVLIGFSTDEAHRCERAAGEVAFAKRRFPLIERGMSRGDCAEYLRERGLPVPGKSSCLLCPYRSGVDWLEIKRWWPFDWAAAVAFDEWNRTNPNVAPGCLYVWKDRDRRCVPLREAVLE